MRKAAGILMILFGGATIGIFVLLLMRFRYNLLDDFGYEPFIIVIELIVLFITGGVFCLKKKYWALCFTSSVFLHLWVMFSFPLEFFPYSWLSSLPPWFAYLSPVGILPLIFICLRKREWQEQEFQG
jgi:hypothetical protein